MHGESACIFASMLYTRVVARGLVGVLRARVDVSVGMTSRVARLRCSAKTMDAASYAFSKLDISVSELGAAAAVARVCPSLSRWWVAVPAAG
jgi:hypothetical protein